MRHMILNKTVKNKLQKWIKDNDHLFPEGQRISMDGLEIKNPGQSPVTLPVLDYERLSPVMFELTGFSFDEIFEELVINTAPFTKRLIKEDEWNKPTEL